MEEKKPMKIKFLGACIIVLIMAIIAVITIIILLKGSSNDSNTIANVGNDLNGATIDKPTQNTVENTSNNTNMNTVDQSSTVSQNSENVKVVPTLRDTIATDSTWCGTFQLVWNDMKNEVVKKDIVFTPQEEMATNLNKGEFTTDMISDQYYFKIYGIKSLELKQKIEEGIKAKFNQTSDILEDFDWTEEGVDDPNNPNANRYFFYTMLYRKFEFLKVFDKLEDGTFGNDKYNNVKYFGIDGNTKDEVGDQIEVIYYNSRDDFAISINTKTNDQVIICKNPQGQNFADIYGNMVNKSKQYTGSKSFENVDEFKAPNLEFNEKREYTELEKKLFAMADGNSAQIEKAIQTVKFSLDETGGEIKSEAAIEMTKNSAEIAEPKQNEPRYFYVDNTFALFLKESGKSMPYFAARIDDISKFQ